jgi:hypothetical protein
MLTNLFKLTYDKEENQDVFSVVSLCCSYNIRTKYIVEVGLLQTSMLLSYCAHIFSWWQFLNLPSTRSLWGCHLTWKN